MSTTAESTTSASNVSSPLPHEDGFQKVVQLLHFVQRLNCYLMGSLFTAGIFNIRSGGNIIAAEWILNYTTVAALLFVISVSIDISFARGILGGTLYGLLGYFFIVEMGANPTTFNDRGLGMALGAMLSMYLFQTMLQNIVDKTAAD